MKLRERLKQARETRAERKEAQIQEQTKKIAYHLYLQRLNGNQGGDSDSDWAKAQKIVNSPVKRSLYMLKPIGNAILSPWRWGCKGISGKTSWEWLELLIVPFFLGVGAFYLENRVETRQERIADERSKQQTLDSYLEKMQELLLDKALRESLVDSEVRSVARALTVTTAKELGAERNALLFEFLRESNLLGIGGEDIEERAKEIALLQGLNLSNANLNGADLYGANLSEAKLSNASLRRANLNSANLNSASLDSANLSFAGLSRVDLNSASLDSANLSFAVLSDANLSNAYLYVADLRYARVSDANLSDAYLYGANLTNAELANSNLSNAYLYGANLTNADLTNSNLRYAYLNETQLDKSVLICQTALPESFTVDPDRDCD